MSPSCFYFGDGIACVFGGGGGAIGDGYGVSSGSGGVRPSISLKSDALQYGTGSSTDPFRISN